MHSDDSSGNKLQDVVSACLSNAEDLIRAARRVLDEEKLPNIAYHLAAIALEEIGKGILITIKYRVSQIDEERGASAGKHVEDHVRKLFWALWTPMFVRGRVTKEEFESLRGLAQRIHRQRLRGLYVETSPRLEILPKDAITESEAQSLITLASTRLEMAKSERFQELSEESKKVLRWFARVTQDPRHRNQIFGQTSMNKFAELGNALEWVRWLKQESEKAEAEGRALAEKELRRSEPLGEEAEQDKWKIRIRLYTNSHSIRPKTLGWWNKTSHRIRLLPVGNKRDQLRMEIILPKRIPVQGLSDVGWNMARKFVAALNIASMGFFWWYVPEHTSTFYEELWDVDSHHRMDLRRQPELRINWGRNALSQHELRKAAVFFSMIAHADRQEEHRPFDYYTTGLAFLGKNDIHLQCEPNAYQQFFEALKAGMRLYGDWDGEKPFEGAFEKEIVTLVPDEEERKRILELGQQLEKIPPITEGITLKEVAMLKILCDAYFTVKFRQQAEKEKTSEASEETAA